MSYIVQSRSGSSYLEYLPEPKRWTWNAPDMRFATKFSDRQEALDAVAQLTGDDASYFGRIIEWPVKR